MTLAAALWQVDEHGLSQLTKEAIFKPPNAELFVVPLSILIDGRTLEQVESVYAESPPDVPKVEITFASQKAVQYTLSDIRLGVYVP